MWEVQRIYINREPFSLYKSPVMPGCKIFLRVLLHVILSLQFLPLNDLRENLIVKWPSVQVDKYSLKLGFKTLYPPIRSSQESQKVFLWLKSGVEVVGNGRSFFLSSETFGNLSQDDTSYNKIFISILVSFKCLVSSSWHFFLKSCFRSRKHIHSLPWHWRLSLKAGWSSSSCLG